MYNYRAASGARCWPLHANLVHYYDSRRRAVGWRSGCKGGTPAWISSSIEQDAEERYPEYCKENGISFIRKTKITDQKSGHLSAVCRAATTSPWAVTCFISRFVKVWRKSGVSQSLTIHNERFGFIVVSNHRWKITGTFSRQFNF